MGDTGHQVRRPGPEGRHADADLAGPSRVGRGHEGRTLLVAVDDDLDGRAAQALEQVEVLLARHREDVFDALGLETFHEEIGCLHINRACKR